MRIIELFLLVFCLPTLLLAADKPVPRDTSAGDRMIAEYFRQETARIADRCLSEVKTGDDWKRLQPQYRRQLQDMLGLDPWPERTDLQPVITGEVEGEHFRMQKLHFQSRPGLYVTGSLYLPKEVKTPVPAVLYVCGHGRVVKNGYSYGNKATYQHHGQWFARHGYVCLIIDTLQLGEIESLHHGTYSKGMWWWNARGYTPAGVEAWNSIRALDYLQSRPEVDPDKLGVTGRSGGGAYSWWLAATDPRVKAAVPVAGITDLTNHVVDGVVEGHCDCMYMVNTYRWDYAQVAALVAPRPLLLSNTDKDGIFPLDGVVRVHAQTRRIYQLAGAANKLGLLITEGPHKDTQELRVPAFHWFNRFLKGDDPLIDVPAEKLLEPEQVRVFDTIPDDQRNTTCHEWFVAKAESPKPNPETWSAQRDGWRRELLAKSFAGWPEQGESLNLKQAFTTQQQGVQLTAYDFISQGPIELRLYLAHRAGIERKDLELVVLNVMDEPMWQEQLSMLRGGFADVLKDEPVTEADAAAFAQSKKMFESFKWGMAYVAPRGIGATAWNQSQRKQVQNRRRFMLLGQTLHGMQVWDARRAAQALRGIDGMAKVPLWMQAEREMAGVALYASLFEPDVTRLDLWHLPTSHHAGPTFLNVMRVLDTPQAVAMAAERSKVRLYQSEKQGWEYPQELAALLGWDPKQIQVRVLPPKQPEGAPAEQQEQP